VHNPEDRSFIGHPRGLGYIAFTEAWERFSYYGMQTLLVLYMTHRLLLPGHVEHVAGFERFRQMLETLYHGHLDIQPLASAIFGLYTGLVYLTPIAGGLLADRFLGRTRTTALATKSGGQVSFGWLLGFHLLNSIGFANLFPVSLALYARVAPAALSATIIGIYYLAFFAANNLVGWIGGFLEKMPATNFWLLHSALCGTAGIIFFVAGRFFGHLLAPGDQEDPGNA